MNKRKIAILGLACLSTAMVIGAVSVSSSKGFYSRYAEAVKYDVTFDGSNGAAVMESLKTKSVTAKTDLDNNVVVEYKNMEVVPGKIGKIRANGFYMNRTALTSLSRIKVTSNAAEGDAVIKWGYTSSCIDGTADLTEADGSINGNFFKIIAKNDVIIEKIEIEFACDDSNNGFVASYGSDDHTGNFEFIKNSDVDGKGYSIRLKSASSSHYEDKIVFPDFYGTGDDFGPVTKVLHTNSYGIFERLSGGKDIYYPETINEFGNYHYNTRNDGITSLTYPRELTKIGSAAVPQSTGLSSIYYNCINLTSCSGGVSSSNQPNLKDIYVSYDVESLNNSFISSLPAGVTIHYEGTEAEWAALVSGKSNWQCSNVICSDTTIATVSLVFPNGKLGDDLGSKDIQCVVGKSITDPGNPTYEGEGVKVFDGWYTESTGGTKVAFPFAVSEDTTLYAHFIDMPAGYSATDPVALSLGENNVMTRYDLGPAYYLTYTATEDETILFTSAESDITMDTTGGGSTYKNVELRIFNADGTRATEDAASNSADMSVKKFAILAKGHTAAVKVRFAAGETYVIGWSANSFSSTGYWGSGKVVATKVDADAGDYTSATTVSVGAQSYIENTPSIGHKWVKFVAPTTGKYTVEFNNDTTAGTGAFALSTIVDGVYTQVTSSNYSKSVKFVELVADQTYYVAVSSNTNGSKTSFKIYSGVPDGENIGQPINFPVDGSKVNVTYNGFAPTYYRMVVSTAGTYVLKSDKDINSSASNTSWDTSTANIQISSTTAFAAEDLVNEFSQAGDSTSKKELYVHLDAGTYYVKSSSSSSASWYYTCELVADPTGLTVTHATEVTIADAENQSLALTDTTGNGTMYKFTAVASKFYSFSCDQSFTSIKIGTLGGSGFYKNYSNSFSVDSSKKEGHKKLTAGTTYYVFVKGSAVTSVNVSVLETIKDGASRDTALDAEVGTQYRANSTSTYYNLLGVAETGLYMVTTDGSYESNFKLYCGDSLVSKASGTSSQRFYNLDSTKSYRIEAYNCNFKVAKVEQGMLISDPIAASIDSSTSAILLENTIGAGGTYYAFTTDYAGWYVFSTNTSGAQVSVTVGSTAQGSFSSAVELGIKPGASKTVYLLVSGVAEGESVSISIEHPETYENGKSIESAWTFTPDAGYAYRRTFRTPMNESGYLYFKVNLVAGVEYYFTIAALDSTANDYTDYGTYNKYVTDAAGNAVYTNGKFDNDAPRGGGTAKEVGYTFTSTVTGEAYLNFKKYKTGIYDLRAYLYPTSDADNFDKTVETSFSVSDFEGSYSFGTNSIVINKDTLAGAFEETEVGSASNGDSAFTTYFLSYLEESQTLQLYVEDESGDNSAEIDIIFVDGSINSIEIHDVNGNVLGYTANATIAASAITFVKA